MRKFPIYVIGLTLFSISLFLGLGLKQPEKNQIVEAQKIILKNPVNGAMIELNVMGEAPVITMRDSQGQTQIALEGGSCAKIVLYNKDPARLEVASGGIKLMNQNNQVVCSIMQNSDASGAIAVKDSSGLSSIEMQGGPSPSMFMKNEQQEIIGAFIQLQDGGGAVGFADKDGDISAFIRGGSVPSLSFFQKSPEPFIALGLSQQLPHFMMYSKQTKDHIILHGGEPTSLLFVTETGDVPILLSKHGLFQGKSESETEGERATPEQNKIFTWDELKDPLKDAYFPKR